MVAHGRFCTLRVTGDDRVDNVPVLVGKGEMGAGFNGNDIEEGRERIVARVEGEARNRSEHLVVRCSGDEAMEVDRSRCVVGPVHDMMNVRISNRVYSVSFLDRCSKCCVAGSLWLNGTPHVEKVDQLVDVNGGSRSHQQGAVLSLPLEDFELLEPGSPLVRQETSELSPWPCQPTPIEGSKESPGRGFGEVDIVSAKFFHESGCANWPRGARQRIQNYPFDTRLINHL